MTDTKKFIATPHKSELDLHIDSIVAKLRVKHHHAAANRYRDVVDFFYGKNLKSVIEVSYEDLSLSMNEQQLPKKILQLI